MTCSQDQTYRDVLYGASYAALGAGGSKMHSFVCGDEMSLTKGILVKLCNKWYTQLQSIISYSLIQALSRFLGQTGDEDESYDI